MQHSLSEKLTPRMKSSSQRRMEQAFGAAADSTLALLRPSEDVWGMMGMESPEDVERVQRVTAVFLEVQKYCPTPVPCACRCSRFAQG